MSKLLDQLVQLSTASDSLANYDPGIIEQDLPNRTKKESSEVKFSTSDDLETLRELDGIEISSRFNKSKVKRSLREKLLSKTAELDKHLRDQVAEEFDHYLEYEFEDEEDRGLSNTLIGYGRKYARESATSADSSEISKAFSGAEKKLGTIMDELDEDTKLIENTLKGMRNGLGKNYKAMSELSTAKNQCHNTRLAIVKELNAIQKTKFDLKFKTDAAKSKAEDAGADNSSVFKSLFGLGRGDMVGSIGGYETISGSNRTDGNSTFDDDYDNDDEIRKSLRLDDSEFESDGDKFLKYEGQGVHWVLLISTIEGIEQFDIIAESAEGEIVPDYPMPNNINQLHFDINRGTMEATDDLKRTYQVRYIDSEY